MVLGTLEESTLAEEVVKKLGEAQQVVAQWLHRVQEKQKDAYDAERRVATDFKVGDEVLVYEPFRKIGRSEKLLHRWRGFYVVVRETSSLNYELPRRGNQKLFTCNAATGGESTANPIGELRQQRGEKGERTARLEAIQEEPEEEEGVDPEISRPEPQETEQSKGGERRSERSRKQPKRYGNLITFSPFMLLLTLLCGAMPCGASLRERFVMSGVVFQNLGEVNFSDSEWVVVTEYEGGPLNDDFKIGNRIKEQLTERATGCLEELGVVKSRFNHLKEAISGKQQRAKRGLIDAGKSVLKWLFGVATDRELEELSKHLDSLSKETSCIVSTLAEQATLVNES
ncbi:hypothetical protein OUZ56_032238 [Daphnia magna]|uniref:Uncharacterized protein n=1 Tax=Daphnia magna TaxID=35525 RepID=A0ABQ9ZWW0_9CRUS|nr:hypothetical protein OUZ56_032238 [Daphnia magna]